ncbi:hypothetical protein [Saccharothrix sp. ALI-22-I]|nr:hypothetical protein [Saccharothrix sp. ALI-22-I]
MDVLTPRRQGPVTRARVLEHVPTEALERPRVRQSGLLTDIDRRWGT